MSPNLSQQIDPIAIRQCQIEQHQVKGPISKARDALFAVGRSFHVIAFQFQQGLERLADSDFIVNDEHRACGRRRHFDQVAARDYGSFRH